MGTRTFRHLLAVCALLLTGCVTQVNSSQEIHDGTSFSHDKYTGETLVVGTELRNFQFSEHQIKSLMTSLGPEGQIDGTWLMLVEELDGYPLVFEIAHDAEAQPLKIMKIDRYTVGRGSLSNEQVGVALPPGYLAAHATTGVDIRVEGRHGSSQVTLPPLYVQGYLKKLQEGQACVKAKTC
jgi:hypothetical protein